MRSTPWKYRCRRSADTGRSPSHPRTSRSLLTARYAAAPTGRAIGSSATARYLQTLRYSLRSIKRMQRIAHTRQSRRPPPTHAHPTSRLLRSRRARQRLGQLLPTPIAHRRPTARLRDAVAMPRQYVLQSRHYPPQRRSAQTAPCPAAARTTPGPAACLRPRIRHQRHAKCRADKSTQPVAHCRQKTQRSVLRSGRKSTRGCF